MREEALIDRLYEKQTFKLENASQPYMAMACVLSYQLLDQ